MKKLLLFVVIALFAIALFTNPNSEDHKTAIKESIRSGMADALKQNGIKDNVGFFEAITGSLYENVIWEELIQGSVERKNLLFFSLTKLSYKDKEYTAGIGAFGKVYVFNEVEKQSAEKINELIKKGGGLRNALGF